MPVHKVFHMLLFITLFLHLIACPGGTLLSQGLPDYTTTTTIEKKLSSKHLKSTPKPLIPKHAAPGFMVVQYSHPEAPAKPGPVELYSKPLSLSIVSTTRLLF